MLCRASWFAASNKIVSPLLSLLVFLCTCPSALYFILSYMNPVCTASEKTSSWPDSPDQDWHVRMSICGVDFVVLKLSLDIVSVRSLFISTLEQRNEIVEARIIAFIDFRHVPLEQGCCLP